jgi:hypothetical protein
VASVVAARRHGFTEAGHTLFAGRHVTHYLIERASESDRPATNMNYCSCGGLGTSLTAGRGGVVRRRRIVRTTITPLLVITLAACSGKPTGTVQRTVKPLGDSETITVRLSSFAFDLEQ